MLHKAVKKKNSLHPTALTDSERAMFRHWIEDEDF
jgi:hypothetical protein